MWLFLFKSLFPPVQKLKLVNKFTIDKKKFVIMKRLLITEGMEPSLSAVAKTEEDIHPAFHVLRIIYIRNTTLKRLLLTKKTWNLKEISA